MTPHADAGGRGHGRMTIEGIRCAAPWLQLEGGVKRFLEDTHDAGRLR